MRCVELASSCRQEEYPKERPSSLELSLRGSVAVPLAARPKCVRCFVSHLGLVGAHLRSDEVSKNRTELRRTRETSHFAPIKLMEEPKPVQDEKGSEPATEAKRR